MAVLFSIVKLFSGVTILLMETNAVSTIKAASISLLILAALFFWFHFVFGLFIWAFVLGDNGPWDFTLHTTVIVSLAYSTFFFSRMRAHRTTRLNRQLHMWISILLLIVAILMMASEFTQRIYGTSPEAAVQSYISVWDLPDVRLNEQPLRQDQVAGCKRYLVLSSNTSKGDITVCPYARFWWTFSRWEKQE